MRHTVVLVAVLVGCPRARTERLTSSARDQRAVAAPVTTDRRPSRERSSWSVAYARVSDEWNRRELLLEGEVLHTSPWYAYSALDTALVRVTPGPHSVEEVVRPPAAHVATIVGSKPGMPGRTSINVRFGGRTEPVHFDVEGVFKKIDVLDHRFPGRTIVALGAPQAKLDEDRNVVRGVTLELHNDASYARVLDQPLDQALYVGDLIVGQLDDGVLWIRDTTSSDAPPSGPVPAELASAWTLTRGWKPMRPCDDLGPAFCGDSIVRRTRSHVAAFERGIETLFVSRTDLHELSRFSGSERARAIAERFTGIGSERWAKSWIDANGHLNVRSHLSIGGCERAHTDVRVIERDGAFWMAKVYTAFCSESHDDCPARRNLVEATLGSIPRRAAPLNVWNDDAYHGDPSVGFLIAEGDQARPIDGSTR